MGANKLHWRVVLVRPRNPLNIGAAARAMANFGLRDLVVVKPYAPVWQETRSAVGAEGIVARARRTASVRRLAMPRWLWARRPVRGAILTATWSRSTNSRAGSGATEAAPRTRPSGPRCSLDRRRPGFRPSS
ncbi:MAG: hypothetical protein DMG25_07295 [Acidobacteria bacterium]|nr:MAG: hypothetical protein DMG25_07295 [Acidobacteriota bacterium]